MIVFRSLVTVILFAAFVSLWLWAWRTARRDDFAAAARLPLEDEAPIESTHS